MNASPGHRHPARPLRIVRMTIAIVIGLPVVFVLLLFGCQRSMIYHPSRYGLSLDVLLQQEPRLRTIEYPTSAGRQVSYYLAPRGGDASDPRPPERLYILCGGNASLALDWLAMLEQSPSTTTGYLMFEYPGYGRCEGKPTRARIVESLRALPAALDEQLGGEGWRDGLGLVGHSLGSAAALEFAVLQPVRRLILISPFTSMKAMAARTVGRPLNELVLDRFDSRARLRELLARDDPPAVWIVHGDRDRVVPVEMGRELAALGPEHVAYREVAGGDHNFILDAIQPELLERMGEQP